MKFTIDAVTMVQGTLCGPGAGGSVQWSLNVESTVLLISGRACEPLRTQAPQGRAGVLTATGRGPCVGQAGAVAALRLRVRGTRGEEEEEEEERWLLAL